jgi:hypothetical protein
MKRLELLAEQKVVNRAHPYPFVGNPSLLFFSHFLRPEDATGGRFFEFDGVLAAKAEDGIAGCLEKGAFIYPAQMLPTKKTKVGGVGGGGRVPLDTLQNVSDTLKQLSSKTAKLSKTGYEVLDQTIPLLEESLKKHPDGWAAVEAAEFLVRQGVARKFALMQMEGWARAGELAARRYGSRFHAEYAVRLASMLPAAKETAPLILELIRAAEGSLDATHPLDLYCRVLWLKDVALRAAGDLQASAALDEKLRKLDARVLDRYREKRPLPKLAKFEGLAADNDRAVVVELLDSPSLWSGTTYAGQAALDGLAASYPPDRFSPWNSRDATDVAADSGDSDLLQEGASRCQRL